MSTKRPVKILHVTPLISIAAAYGGPTSVAEDSCTSLGAAGWDTTLIAGWDGLCPAPSGPFSTVLKRAYKLSPKTFASLFAPGLILWSLSNVRRFDLVHVHIARDLVTMPIALIAVLCRKRLILQPHGMLQPSQNRVIRILDRLATRTILSRAHAVLTLTAEEDAGLQQIAVGCARVPIGNAAPMTALRAQWKSAGQRVIFLSRLHARKRPLAFVEAAGLVVHQRPDVHFELWGPDEGELESVIGRIAALGLDGSCRYMGSCPRSESMARLSNAQIFVLPSFAEPFPMAALESFAVGLPSVITSDTGVSHKARQAEAAIITDGEPNSIASAILQLLESRQLWDRVSLSAHQLASAEFSADGVLEALLNAYFAPRISH